MPGASFPFGGTVLDSSVLAKRAKRKQREAVQEKKKGAGLKKKQSPVKKAVKALARVQGSSPGGASLFQNVRAIVRAFQKDDEEE
jgi:hypothetical protein